MTFKHKLSARLARLKYLVAGAAVMAAAVAACELPLATTSGGDTATRLVVFPPTLTIYPSQTTELMAVGFTASGDTGTIDVSWSVSGGSIISTDTKGGRHYGQYKAGSDTGNYKVVAKGKSGTLADTATVAVIPTPVASVTVTPAVVSLLVGASVQLAATTLDSAGNVLSGRSVGWASSAPAIATVNSSGLVTGATAGSATILATSEGKTGSSYVTVTTASVPVASVSVTPASASVQVGQTVQLTATPRDANGNALGGRAVSWSTSNSSVAAVNSSGLVTSAAAGSATITATSEGKTGSSSVTVTTASVPVASVSVTPASASVQVGQTVQLTATPRDANGNALGGRAVSWSTSNSSVAAVNSSGLVTGAAAGSATITATSEGQSGSSSVTVTTASVPVASVDVAPSTAGIQVGQTVQLIATPRDVNGTALSGRVVTWSSASSSVASVSSSGLVTGGAAGSATITATSEGKSGTATITVTAPAPAPVASVTVAPSAAILVPAQTLQLVAVPRDASGNPLSGRVVTWSSSNAPIADVNGSGLVTAVALGGATITATSEGKSGTSAITVVPPTPGGTTCLNQSGPLVTFTGTQTSVYNNTSMADNTKVNAGTALWLGVSNTPVRIGASSLCWSGGVIVGNYDAATSWDTMHGAYGILVYSAPNAIIENARVHDYGDGISFNNSGSDNWIIRGVHTSISRDDCIENDFGNSGLIEDNLLDGCYVGYSSRSYASVPDNSGKVVTIRNNLWRLVDMPTGYTGPGHGKFWKMDGANKDPRLALHDNIFRMDTPPVCCGDYLIPPPSRLASCSGNIMVWLGSGPFPEPVPSCFTLTTDKTVWDNAVADWKARHPQNAQDFPFP